MPRRVRWVVWWTIVVGSIKLAALAGLFVAARRFGRTVAADRHRLINRPRPDHPALVSEAMLEPLPEPARRYLRHAGVVGRPMVDTVRIRQRCSMRMAPSSPAFPLTAEQWYTVEPPGFIWDATVSAAGIPLVRGRDGYLDGHGLMTIRLASLLPVVDARGPEMDQASLLRHLSEMPWFPSAFLRERVRWEAIDDASVRVSISDGELTASGVLEVDPEGRLVSFRSERFAMVGDGYELRPWTAPTYGYGEFEGLRLPVSGAAVWTLPDGTELPYIDVELTEVEYDPPVPA